MFILVTTHHMTYADDGKRWEPDADLLIAVDHIATVHVRKDFATLHCKDNAAYTVRAEQIAPLVSLIKQATRTTEQETE